jgi:hypothetical protein
MASWRDSIRIHPAADLFPLLDEIDLCKLGEDIKRNGLTSPIAIMIEQKHGVFPSDRKPVLIDGRNRLDAMEIVGLRVTLERSATGAWKLLAHESLDGKLVGVALTRMHILATVVEIKSDPVEYVASANIHRRHLMAETKRELIAKLLKEKPERSDRATAELVKVDGKTVAAVRRQEEELRSIPQLTKRTGKDGKARQQPATKPNVCAVKVDGGADRIKQIVRGFCAPLHELHGGLANLNADSAAVESLLAREARDSVFRERVADVVDGLTHILTKIDATKLEKQRADKAKAEALH